VNGDRCYCVHLRQVHAGSLEFRGLRCPFCLDALLDKCNDLVRDNHRLGFEIEGVKKANALLMKGMESQCELMHELKQKLREKEKTDED
jgi:hypothetical protein